jgi:uncharacterized protein YndB with AHSA1/START domain
MNKPAFVYVIFISAPPEKVWHALTDANATAQYLSGFHVAVEQRSGGTSLFKRGDQVFNRGIVLECDPPHRLSVTWHPELGDLSGEKPSHVTFAIEAIGTGQSRLTIIHDHFAADSKAPATVGEGWMRVAASLKSFVETGKGMDLLAVVEGVDA